MEVAEDSKYWHIACGGTKHEAGTALLARRPQVKPKVNFGWLIFGIVFVASWGIVQRSATKAPLVRLLRAPAPAL